VANGLVTERLSRQAWRASLGDAAATAPTKGEAVAKLESMAAEALSGDYTPCVVSLRGQEAIIYRDPVAGWCYTISGDCTHIPAGRVSLGTISRAGAIERARLHVAQNLYPSTNGLDLLTDPGMILDHCGWLVFQRAYAHRRIVYNDAESHRWAIEQMSCPWCWLDTAERDVYNAARAAIRERRESSERQRFNAAYSGSK